MTDYHLKSGMLPSIAAMEKKEKRRKVLEAVRKRRKIIHKRFMEKRVQHMSMFPLA